MVSGTLRRCDAQKDRQKEDRAKKKVREEELGKNFMEVTSLVNRVHIMYDRQSGEMVGTCLKFALFVPRPDCEPFSGPSRLRLSIRRTNMCSAPVPIDLGSIVRWSDSSANHLSLSFKAKASSP